MRHLILAFALLSAVFLPAQEMECTDNMCAIPSSQTASNAEAQSRSYLISIADISKPTHFDCSFEIASDHISDES